MPKAQSECLAHPSLPRIHFLEDMVGITVILLDPDKPLMMVPGRFLGGFLVAIFLSLVTNLRVIFNPMGIASSLLSKMFETQAYAAYSTNMALQIT